MRLSVVAVMAVVAVLCWGTFSHCEDRQEVSRSKAKNSEEITGSGKDYGSARIGDTTASGGVRLEPTEGERREARQYLEKMKGRASRRTKDALVRMGAPVVPILLKELKESNIVAAQQIMEVLGRLRDERAIPRLKKYLEHENEYLRSAAVYSLSRIDGRQAVPELIERLKDPSPGVVSIAIDILAQLNDDRAIPALIDVIRLRGGDLGEKAGQALQDMTNINYGSDWPSWQLWYDSEVLLGGLGVDQRKLEPGEERF